MLAALTLALAVQAAPQAHSERATLPNEDARVVHVADGVRLARMADSTRVIRVVVAPAETLAVTVRGAGTPVVLLPGLLGSAYTFRHVAPRLVAAGHRVLIVDPLGTGSSSRPKDADYSLEAQAARIAAALDSLGVRRSLLAAHSVGASMALRLADLRPELVRGMVSINGGPDERAGTDGLRSAMKWSFLIKLFGARGTLRGKLEDGLRDNSWDAGWVTDSVVRGYTLPYDEDLGRVLDAMKAIANAEEALPLAPRLPCLQLPVLLLVGAGSPGDAVTPADMAVLATLPRLRVDSVAEAGQYIQEERPDAVVDGVARLRAWVDGSGPGTAEGRAAEAACPVDPAPPPGTA